MPVDLDSDAWANGELNDPVRVKVNDFLRSNDGKAFSIREIEDHLHEEHPEVFPADLVEPGAIDGAKAARQSLITSVLFDRYWKREFTFRSVEAEDETESHLYFARDGPSISPVAEIGEVSDPDPDSPYGTLEGRFKKIESDLDDLSDLEDRIARLEHQVRRELDVY